MSTNDLQVTIVSKNNKTGEWRGALKRETEVRSSRIRFEKLVVHEIKQKHFKIVKK